LVAAPLFFIFAIRGVIYTPSVAFSEFLPIGRVDFFLTGSGDWERGV
jgi:hypothetical protein